MRVTAKKGKVTKRRSMKGGGKEPSSSEAIANPIANANEVPSSSINVNNTVTPKTYNGNSQIHIAAANGDVDKVRTLIEENSAIVDARDENGWGPLDIAIIYNGNLETVKYLIDKGARTLRNKTLLHFVLKYNNNPDILKYFIDENNKSINTKYKKLNTLDIAIENNKNLEIIKYLVEKGAVSVYHSKKGTPIQLHVALERQNNSDLLKYLTDQNINNINKSDDDEFNPLDVAVRVDRNLEIIKYLIEKGAISNYNRGYHGKTILHFAIERNKGELLNSETVKYLIDKNLTIIDGKNRNWDTPLTFAIKENANPEIVKYLIDNGSNLAIRDNDKESTPLHLALMYKPSIEIIKRLVEKGANVNVKNRDGDTPLHLALMYKPSIEIIKYLIEKGAADIRAINKEGNIPLHLAASPPIGNVNNPVEQNKSLEIIKYILDSYKLNKSARERLDLFKSNKYDEFPMQLYKDNRGNKFPAKKIPAKEPGKYIYINELLPYAPSITSAILNTKAKVATPVAAPVATPVAKSFTSSFTSSFTKPFTKPVMTDVQRDIYNAVVSHNPIKVKDLLGKNPDIDLNFYDAAGKTPLIWCISDEAKDLLGGTKKYRKLNNETAIALLSHKGVDPNKESNVDLKLTPLICAYIYSKDIMYELLKRKDIDVNKQIKNGKTLLHIVLVSQSEYVVIYVNRILGYGGLSDGGINLDIEEADRALTPYDHARIRGDQNGRKIMKLFDNYKENIRKYGKTIGVEKFKQQTIDEKILDGGSRHAKSRKVTKRKPKQTRKNKKN